MIKGWFYFMDIKQVVDIIYNGLVSENSIPINLSTNKKLDLDMLHEVRKAFDFAIDYYKDKSLVPKKLAIALVDIYGAFSFKSGYFDDAMLIELEDIGIELQEKALQLFSDSTMQN